jgi:predicted SprT family Zn-dependent metalloprotease
MLSFKFLNRFAKSQERQDFWAEARVIVGEEGLQGEDITVEVSRQCKRVAGNINRNQKTGKVIIKVSYDYYKEFGIQRSIATLRHEMAHLIAFNKLGYMDHGKLFKDICTRLGGTMSAARAGVAHASAASEEYIRRPLGAYQYRYTCIGEGCTNSFERARKISDKTKRYVCNHCSTKVGFWTEEKVRVN